MDHLSNTGHFAQQLVQVLDDRIQWNHSVCSRSFGGAERIFERLFAAVQFTPEQLRVVEYLMNDTCDDMLGELFETLDEMIANDQLRLSIANPDGTRFELRGPDAPISFLESYAADGWRGRFSKIRECQAALARTIGVKPLLLDVDPTDEDEV